MGYVQVKSLKLGTRLGFDVLCNSTTNSGKLNEAWARPRLKAISFASLDVKVIRLCFANAFWSSRTAETTSAALPVSSGDRVAMPTWHASRIVTASILLKDISSKITLLLCRKLE